MKIGVLQLDIKKNIESNILKIIEKIKDTDAEIIVLPELSDRGYIYENREKLLNLSSNVEENKLVKALQKETLKNKKAVIVGIAERVKEKVYNSAVVIENGNITGVYRKVHLTDFEKRFFASGEKNNVFEIKGIKVGIQICFDIWFPEISREQIKKGADMIFVLGNFGGATTYEICKVRAIENLVPIVLCNRVGEEKTDEISASFLGNSTVYDIEGNELIKSIKFQERYIEVEIKEFRKNFNIMCSNFLGEIKKHKINI